MKNPRRIVLTDKVIAEHNLSTQPPPRDSLFWKMWEASKPIAETALQTPFIQGIGAGTLDPVRYGSFNVNDAYYCFNGVSDYRTAAQRAVDKGLKRFIEAKYESYQKYNEAFTQIWHVKDASSIIPSHVCQEYSDFETHIASKEDPIYCLVAMLPCEYLWAWLGERLSPPKPENLYAPWVKENNDPSGAYAMGNFLDYYQKLNPGAIDSEKAITIYIEAMNHELKNFVTAME